VACAVPRQQCGKCILAETCLYNKVFEVNKHKDTSNNKRIAAPPHPYLFEPPETRQTDFPLESYLDFNLILLGEVNNSLPFFVYAIQKMGQMGIGSRHEDRQICFEVRDIYNTNNQSIFVAETNQLKPGPWSTNLNPPSVLTPSQGELSLRLKTPLRQKNANKLANDLPFPILVRAILRRIAAVFTAHAQNEPDLDYKGLIKRADDVGILESNLRWQDIRRYSNRQKSGMLMGGLVGGITYGGTVGEYAPLLELAQYLHLGKQTTFGLGKISYSYQENKA
jgi:hypothetical protein